MTVAQSVGRAADQLPPDISGEWMMDIGWQDVDGGGRRTATALIEHGLGGMTMTVRSRDSDSHTLHAQLAQDSGGYVLYYFYQVEPKVAGAPARDPYKGAAILRFFPGDGELSGNFWTTRMTSGYFRLNRKSGATRDTMERKVDALIIAALEVEFEAIKIAFGPHPLTGDGVSIWTEVAGPEGKHLEGDFLAGSHRLFRVALARSPRMGALSTGVVTAALTERLQPRMLAMAGVCAGNPSELALGDVVVSELAYQYDEGKREKDRFLGDHRQRTPSAEWLEAAKALKATDLSVYGAASDNESRLWLLQVLHAGVDPRKHVARKRYFPSGWKAAVERFENEGAIGLSGGSLHLTSTGREEVERSLVLDLDPPEALPLAIRVGPIASGSVVVKDGVTWEMLQLMGVRTVIGLEMEAAMIGTVAHQFGIADWIVMKGVMDHADPNKEDRYKSFAARASAEALCLFLVERVRASLQPSPASPAPDSGAISPAAVGWTPGPPNGSFFEGLQLAINRHAPAYANLLAKAQAAALEAYAAAAEARDMAAAVRLALGKRLVSSLTGRVGSRPKVLKSTSAPSGGVMIAKIWNTQDLYLGEAIEASADGLGVTRAYQISIEATPSLASTFAGRHEHDKYGPVGVFDFANRSQFAGDWLSGSPSFGYFEFAKASAKLEATFYLGSMAMTPNGHQPIWRPEGDGIAVDAFRRRARCGRFDDGELIELHSEIDF